jgi:uncharacterized Zn-finger protein
MVRVCCIFDLYLRYAVQVNLHFSLLWHHLLTLFYLLFTDTDAVWRRPHPISDSPSTFRSSFEYRARSSDLDWTHYGHHQNPDSHVNQQAYGGGEQTVTPWSQSELKSERLFPCPTCGKRYNYKHNLGRHIRQECGKEPQFHCPYCSHVTKHKASLQKHIRRRHRGMPNVKWD